MPTTTSPTTPTSADATHDPAPTPAPDTYTFKTPSGAEADPTLVAAATPIFKELNLTQPQADKLIELWNKTAASDVDRAKQVIAAQGEKWETELKADKLMGHQLDRVKLDIGRALDLLPPQIKTDFQKSMNDTMAGNHPAMVRAFWELSKLVTEGTHVRGGSPSPNGQTAPAAPTKPTAAQAMYPNLSRAS